MGLTPSHPQRASTIVLCSTRILPIYNTFHCLQRLGLSFARQEHPASERNASVFSVVGACIEYGRLRWQRVCQMNWEVEQWQPVPWALASCHKTWPCLTETTERHSPIVSVYSPFFTKVTGLTHQGTLSGVKRFFPFSLLISFSQCFLWQLLNAAMWLAFFLASLLLAAALVGDNFDCPGDELSVHMPSTASSSMVLLIIE